LRLHKRKGPQMRAMVAEEALIKMMAMAVGDSDEDGGNLRDKVRRGTWLPLEHGALVVCTTDPSKPNHPNNPNNPVYN
jgi:hypothetical protein